jgi:rhamnulokinase
MAIKNTHPNYLEKADFFLMVPDYFHYLLCGIAKNEYTNATTTGLVNSVSASWDMEIIERLGYPGKIFRDIAMPGNILGELLPEISAKVGYSCKVILPATHDTASAVVSIPCETETIYISSGTWSLMGIEVHHPNCSEKAKNHNFTNEGGYARRYRFLKNIMGLWMIQKIKRELDTAYTFAELCDMADKAKIESIVNCNDRRFLSPGSMSDEVRNYCRETGQMIPNNAGELAAIVYRSLANCYALTTNELEVLAGKKYDNIHIIGGGANSDFLNTLTAHATGKTVYAGPTEATAIGNLAVQHIASGSIKGISQARSIIRNSFIIKLYGHLIDADDIM